MTRVAYFVDGFNLYHSMMSESRLRRYRWLDLHKLATVLSGPGKTVVGVHYFTAYTPWDAEKQRRHRLYVRALEVVGVKTTLGAFRLIPRKFQANQYYPQEFSLSLSYKKFEEKRTDVNIALSIFLQAVEDQYDEAAIVSGDSDLLPAVIGIQNPPLAKSVCIVVPPNQKADELRRAASGHMKLREHHFATCQLPLTITTPKGPIIECPDEWRSNAS